jgi:hypothetical protein
LQNFDFISFLWTLIPHTPQSSAIHHNLNNKANETERVLLTCIEFEGERVYIRPDFGFEPTKTKTKTKTSHHTHSPSQIHHDLNLLTKLIQGVLRMCIEFKGEQVYMVLK